MIFRVLELVLLLLLVVVVLTQLIIPAIKGRPLFPFFSREKKLVQEARSINQRAHEAEIRRNVSRKRTKLRRNKNGT